MKITLNNIEEIDIFIEQIKERFKDKKDLVLEVNTLTEKGKYRNQYFKIIGDLSMTSGYKKTDIHDILKVDVLLEVTKKPENRDLNTDLDSTRCLNQQGWDEYLKKCKEYFFEKLNKLF